MYRLESNIKDIAIIHRFYSDEDIITAIPENPSSYEDIQELVSCSNGLDLALDMEDDDQKIYTLVDTTDTVIGLGVVEVKKNKVFLGYRVLSEYRGKGVGSAILNLLIHKIFSETDYSEIRTEVSTQNFVSLRVSTKFLDFLELKWDDKDQIYNKIFRLKKSDWLNRKSEKPKKLKTRTFGLELEISDIERKIIEYPAEGYGIDLEERDVINSNRLRVSPKADFGCEITTRPYEPKLSDIRELKNFIDHLKDKGGTLNWTSGFDMHILASDFTAEDLVNFFLCGCHVTMYALEVFKAPKWFEDSGIVPIPSKQVIDKVAKAKNLNAIYEALANSSDKGFYRYPFNIATFYKHKTLEYRFFNGTWNFRELLEMLRFGYKFLNTVKNNPDSIYIIKSKREFIDFFGIKEQYIPTNPTPLIFAGNSGGLRTTPTYIDRAFQIPNKKVIKAVSELCEDNSVIHSVNPYMFQVELNLLKTKGVKKVICYTVSEDIMVMYNIIKKGYTIKYVGEFDFLNNYKDGTILKELQCYWLFQKSYLLVRSTKAGKDDYNRKNFTAIKNKAKDSFRQSEKYLGGIVEAILSDKIQIAEDYGIWNAIQYEIVVYQQQYEEQGRSPICSFLDKTSSYAREFKIRGDNVNFKILPPKLVVVSRNKYLDLSKYFVSLSNSYVCVYTNMDKKEDEHKLNRTIHKLEMETVEHTPPPDDLVIDNPDDLYVELVSAKFLNALRKIYVNKVELSRDLGRVDTVICVRYKQYTLGLLAFSFMAVNKSADLKKYSTKLDCDFSCNSNVPLLSKLVIMISKTREVKMLISRKYKEDVTNAITKAYTTKPVSMKYRGVYKKVGRVKGGVKYMFEFGTIPSIKDAVIDYNRRVKNRQKK